jgi:hypothetical protein
MAGRSGGSRRAIGVRRLCGIGAWAICPHRRFATPVGGGFWAPSDSWLDCEASPVLFRQILRSHRRDSSAGSTRNGSSRPLGLSTAWTTRRCRGVRTPMVRGSRPGSAAGTPRRHERARRVVGSLACRRRPQPHPPDRNAAEGIPPNSPTIWLQSSSGRVHHAGDDQANAKRTKAPPQSPRPKTKNEG